MESEGHEVKVLSFWASPFAMRVKLALELKGIPYDFVEEDLSNKSKLLLDSNPLYGKVPVLLHNGKAICESSIILEYIEEAFKDRSPSLLPHDPAAKAEVKLVGSIVDNKLFTVAFRNALLGDEATKKAALEDFKQTLKIIDSVLEKQAPYPFFGGEHPNYADVMFAPLSPSLFAWSSVLKIPLPDREECPRLYAFCDAISKHPAAEKVIPSVEKITGYLRGLVELWNLKK